VSGFAHRAELAAWRSEVRPDALQCHLLFGVGPATLERIESGEVEPEADIAERIARHVSGQRKLPGSAFDRSADPTGAGGRPLPDSAGAFFGGGAGETQQRQAEGD